jgi:hypothetical protein
MASVALERLLLGRCSVNRSAHLTTCSRPEEPLRESTMNGVESRGQDASGSMQTIMLGEEGFVLGQRTRGGWGVLAEGY